MSKFDPKIPKGSVPNGQSKFANRYAIRWFKCKLKPPKNNRSTDDSSSTSTTILTDAIEKLVERLKLERFRDSTRENYYKVWKNFNAFYIKLDKKPDTWEDKVILYIGYLIEQERSSQTLRSYLSAIRAVLIDDKYELKENKFLLSALTKACSRKCDKLITRMPIRKKMLQMILNSVIEHFKVENNQMYLSILYRAMFSTAYFGLFRIGAITESQHTLLVTDVYIADNKKKILFILRSSKTHEENDKPQFIHITVTDIYPKTSHIPHHCLYNLIREFIKARPPYRQKTEKFFVYKDRSPVKPQMFRSVLRDMIEKSGFNPRPYSGHSFRIGRGSDLLKMGVSVETIKKIGTWTSNVVFPYLRTI